MHCVASAFKVSFGTETLAEKLSVAWLRTSGRERGLALPPSVDLQVEVFSSRYSPQMSTAPFAMMNWSRKHVSGTFLEEHGGHAAHPPLYVYIGNLKEPTMDYQLMGVESVWEWCLDNDFTS